MITMQPGMGFPDSSGPYRHEIGLGEGNKLGHVAIHFWSIRDDAASARSDARAIELRDRLTQLLEADEECQRILIEEQKDQRR